MIITLERHIPIGSCLKGRFSRHCSNSTSEVPWATNTFLRHISLRDCRRISRGSRSSPLRSDSRNSGRFTSFFMGTSNSMGWGLGSTMRGGNRMDIPTGRSTLGQEHPATRSRMDPALVMGDTRATMPHLGILHLIEAISSNNMWPCTLRR